MCCQFELGHKAWIPRSFGGTREGDGIHKYTRVVVTIGRKWRRWKMKHVTVVEDSVGLGWHCVYLKQFLFLVAFHVVADLMTSIKKSFLWNWYELIIWYSTRVFGMFQTFIFIYSAIFSCLLLPESTCVVMTNLLESVLWRRASVPRWMLRRTAVWTCICPMIWYSSSVCGLMYWFLSISLPVFCFLESRFDLCCSGFKERCYVITNFKYCRIRKANFGWHELLSARYLLLVWCFSQSFGLGWPECAHLTLCI